MKYFDDVSSSYENSRNTDVGSRVFCDRAYKKRKPNSDPVRYVSDTSYADAKRHDGPASLTSSRLSNRPGADTRRRCAKRDKTFAVLPWQFSHDFFFFYTRRVRDYRGKSFFFFFLLRYRCLSVARRPPSRSTCIFPLAAAEAAFEQLKIRNISLWIYKHRRIAFNARRSVPPCPGHRDL